MASASNPDLEEFVRRSDELGGPGSPACDVYWQKFSYTPDFAVDAKLDPFEDNYVSRQINLYEIISGRTFDQINEYSPIDVDTHVAARNPYNHSSPGGLALHLQRLTRALHVASPPLGGRLLDMGCGWGLSSEIAAYCGLNVTAVDISPDFVRLVETRARERGLAIVARQGTFDTFNDDHQYDAVLFYECLHHALRIWTVVARMADKLTFDGKIVLAGEPVNDIWWKNWGMRLDPLSVYCIKKFGWFESGWSLDFLNLSLRRAGLTSKVEESDVTGLTIIADFSHQRVLNPTDISRQRATTGWLVNRDYLTSQGEGRMAISGLGDGAKVRLALTSFRSKPLRISVDVNGEDVFVSDIAPGQRVINLVAAGPTMNLCIRSDLWCPDEELANGDHRRIGVHLRAVGIVPPYDRSAD